MSEYKGSPIGSIRNYDDTFTRDLIVATLAQFRDRFKWEYRRDDGQIDEVIVPVYMAMTGDPQFLIDLFTDDPSQQRVNTSVAPRPLSVLTLTDYRIIPDELSNPNVSIRRIVPDNQRGYQTFFNKVAAVPMEYNFELKTFLSSESDMFRFTDVLMDTLFRFRFYKFEHKHTSIQSFFTIPDNYKGQGNKTLGALSGDTRELVITQNIVVKTKKPVFDTNEETKQLADNKMERIVDYITEVYNRANETGKGIQLSELWVPDPPPESEEDKNYSKPIYGLDDPVDYGDED